MAGNSLSPSRNVEGHSTPVSGARNRDASTHGGRVSPKGFLPLSPQRGQCIPQFLPPINGVGLLEVI
jgi:hypothetical protein